MRKLVGLIILVMFMALLVACGDPTATTAPATTAAASKAGSADDAVKEIAPSTQSGDYKMPLDSTPDLDGANIYFTAANSKGSGVFKVPAGGGAASPVFTGAPFAGAKGIAMSPDGKQIYVADPKVSAGGKTGQLFSLAVEGGAPQPVAGSAGTAPQNLDVVNENGQTDIYFSGKDPASGQPALLKLPATGSETATVVAKGAPLVEPDGVAVTKAGLIYLSDRAAAGNGLGKVFKVAGGAVTPVVEKVKTGNPAGIALNKDETALLVSALQMDKASDQVLVVNLGTMETASVTKVVSQNSAAGGVHILPSRDKNIFSWADLTAGGAGTVYRVELK